MTTLTSLPTSATEILADLRAATATSAVRRRVQSEFVLADLPDTASESQRKAVVQVTTFHHAERKQYVTSVQQVETARSTGSAFMVTKFALFSGVTLTRVPVARHSAKALQAAHEQGLGVLQAALTQNHPQVVEQFEIKEHS